MTKAICPCVSTAAFGRPVVPDVKKKPARVVAEHLCHRLRLAQMRRDQCLVIRAELCRANGDGGAGHRRARGRQIPPRTAEPSRQRIAAR